MTHRRDYDIAAAAFADLLVSFRQFETEFASLQRDLERQGAPWTPGRGLPDWPPP